MPIFNFDPVNLTLTPHFNLSYDEGNLNKSQDIVAIQLLHKTQMNCHYPIPPQGVQKHFIQYGEIATNKGKIKLH
jgi:hypothetical protein